jgi:hypothetical protein
MALSITGASTNAAGTKVLLALGVGNPPIDSVALALGPTVPKSLVILADSRSVSYSAYTLESGGGAGDATAVIGITLSGTIYRGETVTVANGTAETRITDADNAGLPTFTAASATNNSTVLREPVIEMIRQNIVTTLAVTAGAYWNTLAAQDRTEPWNPRTNAVGVVSMGNEEELQHAGGFRQLRRTFQVEYPIKQAESATIDLDTLANRIAHDVYVALQTDYTRGGYALDTSNTVPEIDEDGITISFTVDYRHRWADPTRHN